MKKEVLFDIFGDINIQYVKEAHMKNKRGINFPWVKWGTIAACFAVFILAVPQIIQLFPTTDDNTPPVHSSPVQNNNQINELQQSAHSEAKQPEKSNILVVNEVTKVMSADMDVQINTLDKLQYDVWTSVLEEFQKFMGIPYEEFTNKIPDAFEYYQFYTLSTPEIKDANVKDKYYLHDYVFEYHTENGGEATIAICSFEEPLRDYLIICDNPIQSEINGVEVFIYGYQECFKVQFCHENINYDIETSNVTLSELEDLLENIMEVTDAPSIDKISKEGPETIIEDIPADSKGEYNEVVNSSDLTKDCSRFFGGSYTDANGKFVIVLTEDTPANRTAICKELSRSESNTTFVKGTYTLAYLTELQAKITYAMVNRELPFVVTSGVYETTNNIIIGVTTDDEAELAKVYALDTIGDAIKVEFRDGSVTEKIALPEMESSLEME